MLLLTTLMQEDARTPSGPLVIEVLIFCGFVGAKPYLNEMDFLSTFYGF